METKNAKLEQEGLSVFDLPILLSSDNFMPLNRTPWGGTKIGRFFKSNAKPGLLIGEAWEFSCDPNFPSRAVDLNLSLIDLVRQNANEILPPALAKKEPASCEIKVKLLDANSPLSLQVHPQDNDPYLKETECGKPETWLILQAEKDAGIYLGFSEGTDIDQFSQALKSGADIRPFLQFVPVKPYDYFEIAPGVPHAVGAGVTLLEPQRILFNKSGKTYRIFDWNRRYNSEGHLDPVSGKARELHIVESLRLIDPKTQQGEAFVEGLRGAATSLEIGPGIRALQYPKNPYYQVTLLRLSERSVLPLELVDAYAAAIMLKGAIEVEGKNKRRLRLSKGQPSLWPYATKRYQILALADTELVFVIPGSGEINWR